MHFLKIYKSGGADYDPRQKVWALYKCSNCDYEHDFDITTNKNSFDFNRKRKCPECNSFGTEDHIVNLRAEIENLTKTKKLITQKIETLIKELESKIGVNN